MDNCGSKTPCKSNSSQKFATLDLGLRVVGQINSAIEGKREVSQAASQNTGPLVDWFSRGSGKRNYGCFISVNGDGNRVRNRQCHLHHARFEPTADCTTASFLTLGIDFRAVDQIAVVVHLVLVGQRKGLSKSRSSAFRISAYPRP